MGEMSVFLIPIVAMMIPIVAIIAGAFTQVHNRRVKADERMAMIARGIPLAEIDAYMNGGSAQTKQEVTGRDPMRALGNARRASTVLISIGLGLIAFFLIFGFVMLTQVNRTAGWALMACSAAGLIPLAIGLGFAFDYRMQKREMSRFGLEVEAEKDWDQ